MKKIMVVDDAMFMRLSIKTMVEKHGFKVVGEADCGTTALRIYPQCKPDIVTMDITMPGLNGIETLKELKSLDPQAKVVIVSGMGQEDRVKEAIIYGAVTFIVKPFQEDYLIQTLNKVAVV